MKISIAIVIALVALLTGSADAATYTINVSEDDSGAHDINPGDGICRDSFNSCPLRAAIEEANAHAGVDTILFASSFVNVIVVLNADEGPLPTIEDKVFILGTSISAYNSSATLLRDAPPQFFVDGSNLTSNSDSGLQFSGAAASGSIVSAIGIINFPNHGILTAFGANNLVIDRNFIGARADASSAGNGGYGLYAISTGGHRIGKARNTGGTAFLSLGNVISSNGLSGIRLESSNDNDLRGNLIGISPSGTGDRGNGNYGIQITGTGTGNDIGDYVTSSSAGNFVAGNNFGGIFSVGSSNRFYANALGIGETGGFINSEGDGIVVIGNSNFIGNNNRGGNRIVVHAGSAIRLGVAGGTASNTNVVLNNEIGSSGALSSILFSGNGQGISIDNGNSNAIVNCIVINSQGRSSPNLLGFDLYVGGNSNSIEGNRLGFAYAFAGAVAQPNVVGMGMLGDNNNVGSNVNPNQVGGNTFTGITASGNGNSVHDNFMGVTDALLPIGNLGTGLVTAYGVNVSLNANIVGNNNTGVLLNSIADSPNIVNNYIGVAADGTDIHALVIAAREKGGEKFDATLQLREARFALQGGDSRRASTLFKSSQTKMADMPRILGEWQPEIEVLSKDLAASKR